MLSNISKVPYQVIVMSVYEAKFLDNNPGLFLWRRCWDSVSIWRASQRNLRTLKNHLSRKQALKGNLFSALRWIENSIKEKCKCQSSLQGFTLFPAPKIQGLKKALACLSFLQACLWCIKSKLVPKLAWLYGAPVNTQVPRTLLGSFWFSTSGVGSGQLHL